MLPTMSVDTAIQIGVAAALHGGPHACLVTVKALADTHVIMGSNEDLNYNQFTDGLLAYAWKFHPEQLDQFPTSQQFSAY